MDYCRPSYNLAENVQQDQMYQGLNINLENVQQSDHQKHDVQKPNEKKLVVQQNEAYKMELSESKTIVLNMFHENMYAHVWDNKSKMIWMNFTT